MLTMYPNPSFIEQMGIDAFNSKVEGLSEEQSRIIIGRLKLRLT